MARNRAPNHADACRICDQSSPHAQAAGRRRTHRAWWFRTDVGSPACLRWCAARFIRPQACIRLRLRLIRVTEIPPCRMRPGPCLHRGRGLCAMNVASSLLSTKAGSANIRQLQGPILVLGASGFIGANLLRMLLEQREDVYGTATRLPAWRLEGLPQNHVLVTDLLIDSNLDALLETIKPRTIFDCIAYGAYSFETDRELI